MRQFKLALLVFFSIILQTTILRHISIIGVAPNLLFTIAVCYSIMEEDIVSVAAMGFACGAVLDIFGMYVFGLSALLCLYIVIACSITEAQFFKNSLRIALMIVFVFSIVYETLYLFFKLYLWTDMNFLFSVVRVIIPTAMYNTIAAVPMYFLLKKSVRFER